MLTISVSELVKELTLSQLASFVVLLTFLEITKILEEENATHIQIIPKIENQEGIDNNIDEILKFLMV